MAELLRSTGRNILVDVDNTINNLQIDLLKFANKRLPEKRSYSSFDSAAMESTEAPFDLVAAEFFDSYELMGKSRPFIGAVESVALLKDSGFNVHVSSGRPAKLQHATVEWLERNGFMPYVSSVQLRAPGQTAEQFKLGAAKELDVVAVFEDTKSVAELLASNGITVHLIRRPWNKEIKRTDLIKPAPSFKRAVSEFLNYSFIF